MPPTIEKLVLSAEGLVRKWLEANGTRKAGKGGNFPPTCFVKVGAKIAYKVVDIDRRHEEIRRLVKEYGADGFVFVYDGMMTLFSTEEKCERCQGAKCDECLNTGHKVENRRQDAVVLVSMKRGDLDVKVKYVPYSVEGGKVQFLEAKELESGGEMMADHQYREMFGKERVH